MLLGPTTSVHLFGFSPLKMVSVVERLNLCLGPTTSVHIIIWFLSTKRFECMYWVPPLMFTSLFGFSPLKFL